MAPLIQINSENVAQMTPRWIKTNDYEPSPHKPRYADDDWLMLSGEWVVGRVSPAYGGPHTGCNWMLTGPHTSSAPISTRGTGESADAAKAELLTSWRRWQEWAGMRDA
jgi:hypothetical protein